MAVTYTWTITGIKTKDEGANTNAIVQTYWKKIGTDENGNTAEFIGATPFTSVNVPEGEFVPLNELTEETVLGWIQSQVTGAYEQHVNEQIAKKLNASSEPREVSMPWAPDVPVTPEPNTDSGGISDTPA